MYKNLNKKKYANKNIIKKIKKIKTINMYIFIISKITKNIEKNKVEQKKKNYK